MIFSDIVVGPLFNKFDELVDVNLGGNIFTVSVTNIFSSRNSVYMAGFEVGVTVARRFFSCFIHSCKELTT
jgi:hypothetical protein